jgi:hypothetical protein
MRWREHICGIADRCTSGEAGGDRGRRLARGGGACSSLLSSVSRARRVWHLLGNPRYLMPAHRWSVPVISLHHAPSPPASPLPDPARPRPRPRSPPAPPKRIQPVTPYAITTQIQKDLQSQTSVSITAPLTAQTLPSTAPEVYYDTACQLVPERSRPIRRPDKYLRPEMERGSDFAVMWP